MSFDSLTFARRLKAAGFSESQAEALADASREMVIHDLATKDDLVALKSELNTAIAALEERLTLRLTVNVMLVSRWPGGLQPHNGDHWGAHQVPLTTNRG